MSEKPAARLYVPDDLASGATLVLAEGQAHYLRNVLRLGPGAALALFNGRDGEWLGRIDGIAKGKCSVALSEQARKQVPEPDLWLVFAPVKRARIDYLVEKATELGVAALYPVRTARTIVERVNLERLQANAVEAAEQTERLAVPVVHPPESLPSLIARWPQQRRLIVCDERGRAPPIAEIVAELRQTLSAGAAVLIGPEGGFTETELDGLANLPFVNPVSLGPRVLRADTAALAALAVFQAVAGDWRENRAG
ncbi:MAG TPA: 16S rRNA (uracil(1498)-N(3))-methyltransferase [Stellaceae bacterium]|nr:16S rRNA (uracil(1498)-N(3))-methyltransferase [Stellaceae bacterium]